VPRFGPPYRQISEWQTRPVRKAIIRSGFFRPAYMCGSRGCGLLSGAPNRCRSRGQCDASHRSAVALPEVKENLRVEGCGAPVETKTSEQGLWSADR